MSMENIISALFKVESEAYQAFSELKRAPRTKGCLISQMSLIKKQDGLVTAYENFDTGHETANETIIGGIIGSIIGILAGPLGVFLGAGVGALIGETLDTDDAFENLSMVENVAARLNDGEIAVIILVQEKDKAILNEKLEPFHPLILRWDAAYVKEDVEDAELIQLEMARKLRGHFRKQKSEERMEKVTAYKEKFKNHFSDLKNKEDPK